MLQGCGSPEEMGFHRYFFRKSDGAAALYQYNNIIQVADGMYVARLLWNSFHPTQTINDRVVQMRLISSIKRSGGDPQCDASEDTKRTEKK